MSFLRIILALGALLCTVTATAADVTMGDGSVSFRTPDNWLSIMEIQGDPEVHAFQVPDPSPTAAITLARVTVTVKQIADANDYALYVTGLNGKARALTGYHEIRRSGSTSGGDNAVDYSAKENGVAYNYHERYWLKGSHAIQLRCARPSNSQAGAAWITAFDKGCDAIAARLQP